MGGASWSGRGLGIELRNLDAARAHGLWIRNPDADERADTRCLQPWADRHAAHTHTHTHTQFAGIHLATQPTKPAQQVSLACRLPLAR